MSSWSDIRLVAAREVDEKLHNKPFLISVVFFLLIIAVSVALPAVLSDDGPEEFDVAVVSQSAREVAAATQTPDVEVKPTTYESVAAAETAVRDADVDAALLEEGPTLQLAGMDDVPEQLAVAIGRAARVLGLSQALAASGADPDQISQLLAPVQVQQVLLDDRGVDAATIALTGIAFALVFFFVVFTFGFAIAQTVVQEKESRVVELLVATVPIRVLLAGKVAGNSLLALGQVVLLGAVALGGAAVTGQGELVGVLAANSGWFLLFFLLGFVMLACLWAVTGSLATRNEDLQSTTAPLQALVLLPFFAAIYVRDGTAQVVLSFVPFSAPLVMPQRLIAQDAALWEAGLSAVVLLATAVALIAVGARLYRASLLRTRGKTSLRQALTARHI